MDNNKKYWKGLEELNNTPGFQKFQQKEFAEELPIEEMLNVSDSAMSTSTSRRDFMKIFGFGVGAVTLAACNEAPVRKAIPYLVKPEEVTPGVPNYYASNFEGVGVLVKTREGRPIKIEGNPNCPIGQGGVDAVGHASVLNLYDEGRLKNPMITGAESNWDAVDSFVKKQLKEVAEKGAKIRVLSSTIMSPSSKAIITDFIKKYPSARHITYDAVSASAIINATKNSFDKAVLPSYRFDKAEVIVSFGADFLGTWISPVEYSKQYTSRRGNKALKENKTMSRHIQFEAALSLTGSNADTRVPVKPSQEGLVLLNLYNAVATLAGAEKVVADKCEVSEELISNVAKELYGTRGKSLVVSGSNDVSVQVMVNALNSVLGNIGATVDLDNPSYQKQGNDAEFAELVAEMNKGEIGLLFVWGANPSYDYVKATEFTEGLKKVKCSVSFADRADETAMNCTVMAPNHHYLESWGDSEAKKGVYGMTQPAISPVFNTRSAQQLFLNLLEANTDYFTYLKSYWSANILSKATTSWNEAVRSGSVVLTPVVASSYIMKRDLAAVASSITGSAKNAGKVELVVYEKVSLRDGRYANNPWLQEMPDPVSKVTWDNYAAVSPKFAKDNNIAENSVVEVKANGYSVKLPVLVQPGQAYGTVAIALGYGRTAAGKCGNGIGINAFPFVTVANGTMQYTVSVAEITVTGEQYELAQTQTHHSIEGRAIIKETTLKEYQKNPRAGNEQEKPHIYDLWDKYEKPGHAWGMAIDLNACTGCGACIVSCQAENNVAVVGREEVRRRREMHWIRIDRYYTFSDDNGTTSTKEKEYNDIDRYDNVTVAFQPMMCQHCDHAPCETVCPVLATMHSSEGLNQQVYNRCVGTKYCANNCPYKVRRFNWFNYADNSEFDYNMNNNLGKLVLNPDVTVRSRGVMEKCSLCVQRIQAGKLAAKVEGKKVEDGSIQTACSQSCPADAIVFGDMNDPESRVSQLLKDERTYYVLEELNVQPGVGYMTKVRNA